MPSLDLEGKKVSYEVVRGTGRRYTYFHFRSDLTLEVVLPMGKRVDVVGAIRERSAWVRREYEKMSQSRHVLTAETVLYAGSPHMLVFHRSSEESLTFDPGNRQVLIRAEERRSVRELIRRWFLKDSSSYAVRKVAELAPRLGVRPNRVDVREIGKWGYCTRDGRLSFSWQLVSLPDSLREYVILHELTHLLEFNHSSAFKRKLAAVCPDFRVREKELDLVVPYDRLEPPS